MDSSFRDSGGYKVYSSRWSTLLIFCFINMCNAILWVTFAPISDISADYFGGDIGNATAVNMLATSFLIFFAPGIASFPLSGLYFFQFFFCVLGTLLGVISMKSYGMRNTILFGGILDSVDSADSEFSWLELNSPAVSRELNCTRRIHSVSGVIVQTPLIFGGIVRNYICRAKSCCISTAYIPQHACCCGVYLVCSRSA
jgi:hypothetical protein